MKKKIKKEVEMSVSCCNICKQEIINEPFNKKRIDIVRGLFKTEDFDAHEGCINKIVREAFAIYVSNN